MREQITEEEVRRKVGRIHDVLSIEGKNSQVFDGLDEERAQELQFHAFNLGYGTTYLGKSRKYDPLALMELHAVEVFFPGVQNA